MGFQKTTVRPWALGDNDRSSKIRPSPALNMTTQTGRFCCINGVRPMSPITRHRRSRGGLPNLNRISLVYKFGERSKVRSSNIISDLARF